MNAVSVDLPDDVKMLQAMIVALREREVGLRHIIDQLQGWRFGARSEKLSPDQYDLALEDREIACAEAEALADQSEAATGGVAGKPKAKRSGDARASVPADCRPKRWSLTCWFPNMLTTCRSTGKSRA